MDEVDTNIVTRDVDMVNLGGVEVVGDGKKDSDAESVAFEVRNDLNESLGAIGVHH